MPPRWPLGLLFLANLLGPAPDEIVSVVLVTERGPIQLAVDLARAAVTAANFLRYVDGGHYDGGVIHRTVRLDNQPDKDVLIEVIQGGVNPARRKDGFAPIASERTRQTGLSHKDGTLFGRVTSGMDVVRAIQNAHAEGQRLTPPVRILSARRR